MKKFLSIILSVILLCSIMMPVTVFAENGPYPNDFENLPEDGIIDGSLKMSAIGVMIMPTEEDILNSDEFPFPEIYFVYPEVEGFGVPSSFGSISYNQEKNTLTLKNFRNQKAVIAALSMGDDFKIKLSGYNEIMCLSSSGMGWGGAVTLTGSGELVVNKLKNYPAAVEISADDTAAFFKAEKDVNLKLYSDVEYGGAAIAVYGSTITDPSKLIQLEGKVKAGGAIVTEPYTVNVYEQVEAYDLFWDTYEYIEAVFTKDGVTYAGVEDYDYETYEPNGKYFLFSVVYDGTLGRYVGTPVSEESIDPAKAGYTVKMNGAIPAYMENVFIPTEKMAYDIALDENGKKYGFEEYGYYNEETGEIDYEYTVYELIEHPTYGYVAKEVPNKYDLAGLTAQKIGEKEYMDAYTLETLTMNNGGSVLPKAVKLLSATNVEDGVEIKWQASTRATKYKIYRKGPNDKSWVGLDTVDGSKTSYVDESAKSGVKYTYTVRACNIVGWGSYDKTGLTKTYVEEPDFDVKATTSGVKVSWKKVAGATEYKVYRKAAGESKWTALKTTTSTSFTDKTAKNGKTYTYGVKALKGKAASSYDTEKITFVSTPKLASAKNVKDGVEIKWNAVSGATKYRVYRKASGEKSWTKLADTTKLAYTDKTAKSGKTYSYTVKAYKDSSASAVNSTGLSVKYLAAPTAKLSNTASGVKISWGKVSGAKEYKVYRKAAGEKSWTALKVTTGTSYTDKTAKNGKTYTYTVKALNGKAASATKNVKTAFVATPKLSKAENTDGGIKISWGKVSGATKYRVYRKASGETSWSKLADTTKTSFEDTSVAEGKVYTYTVRAYKDSYGSSYNKTGLSRRYVKTYALYTPTNEKDGILLRFDPSKKADKYYIYREVKGTDTKKQIAVLDPADLEKDQYGVFMYVDKTAKEGETYAYYLRASYKGTFGDMNWSTQRYIFRLAPVDVVSVKETSDGVKISWEKSQYAECYAVYRKVEGVDEYFKSFRFIDDGKTSTIDSSVESGKKYTYAVAAWRDANHTDDGMACLGNSKTIKVK
ncbi:MAG: hypothetical protein E7533_05830 [Ruminococcaceae bacterium]|nr:hypothetical protein [Oscillospiraceae bacterium]